jgi:hypothetical protein
MWVGHSCPTADEMEQAFGKGFEFLSSGRESRSCVLVADGQECPSHINQSAPKEV